MIGKILGHTQVQNRHPVSTRLREPAGMSKRARLGWGTGVVPTNQEGTVADV